MTLAPEILHPSDKLLQPEDWEEFAVFRETFLSLYLNRENAESFRVLGRFLYEGLLCDVDDQRTERDDETTVARFQAAVLDLRYMQGFLASIVRELEDQEVGVMAAPLCLEARAAIPQIEALARRLEDAIAGVVSEILEAMERASGASPAAEG